MRTSKLRFFRSADDSAKKVCNFASSEIDFQTMHTRLKGSIGYVGCTEKDILAPFVAAKHRGYEVGHFVSFSGSNHLIKIGLTPSYLGQALQHHARLDPRAEYQVLGYIDDVYTRITDGESQKNTATDQIQKALDRFKTTANGKSILDSLRAGKQINTHDINLIYRFLTTQSLFLRNVIGLSAFADVVNAAYGQFFSNQYHKLILPEHYLDNHQLLVEQNAYGTTLYTCSRYIPDSMPFDKFLVKPFLEHAEESFIDKKTWITHCQMALAKSFVELRGLCAGILIRHLMGENSDLGPDNMLIIERDGIHYVVNIDVTGFRHDRKKDTYTEHSNTCVYGWEETLRTEDSDALLNRLFHHSVFCDRFLRLSNNNTLKNNLEPIMHAIVDVLKQKILPGAMSEFEHVRQWLKNHDVVSSKKNMEVAIIDLYNQLSPDIKPDISEIKKFIKYNRAFLHEIFISDHEFNNEHLFLQ